eukprot:Plantae.Rhodophyta-Purpureofilum_apyrenoidigerum.ctg15771.p1 GENE.Plantae.Rhodophyta-Purpureofilum_apyrenoidigerum.ctg15771~~Plantae.Rhodophyta-Purpureofilum_apyrenoidigerum.ctg15771.p1  ORF type:complete len:400 (+),score=52.71 Plantae.Rhodophyta-Purpureofilum_apyrenoidigerum.ctg15771:485-1684(+)
MTGLSLQTFAGMSSAQISWLFFDDSFELDSAGPVEDTINAVLEAESARDCLQPMMREMLKPAVVTKRFIGGVCFGQGWITGNSIGAGLDSDGQYFREMRITINTDMMGNVSTIVSVQNDSVLHIGTITELDGNTVSVTVQKALCSGILMAEAEEQVFMRCCTRCSSTGDKCGCAVNNYLMQAMGPRPSEITELRAMDLLGFFSGWSVGTWKMVEFEDISIPTLNIRYTTSPDQVEKYCSHREQISASMVSGANTNMGSYTLRSHTYSGSGSVSNARSSATTQYGCDCCTSVFKTSYDLKRHITSVHDKKRQHLCRICKRGFSQSGHRNEHERLVHSGLGHPCNICGNRFGVHSKLQRHIRSVHENVRTHQCGLCGKMFKEKNHLKKHTASHQKHDLYVI